MKPHCTTQSVGQAGGGVYLEGQGVKAQKMDNDLIQRG